MPGRREQRVRSIPSPGAVPPAAASREPRAPRSVSPAVRHIVLLGLMGSGKSTVGRLLARRLGWRYRDNDVSLTSETGATAREINARLGPEALHRLEARDLLDALASTDRAVVGAAASTIEHDASRQALARPSVFPVWLRVDPAILSRRVHTGDHRPELAANLQGLLERQHASRGPLFASVALLVVDSGEPSPDEIATAIAGALPG